MSDHIDNELEDSIKKWQDIIAGNDGDKGSINCSLCQQYLNDGCIGCVVQRDANQSFCYGTPFREWFNHHKKEHSMVIGRGRRIECPTCLELAKKELDYLKSLR